LSAAIVANGSVAWARGFGQADLQSGRLATDTTSYHLASLTKVFAVINLMQLVEASRVSLDDPVSKYGIRIPGSAEIRVRHLLNHTSESTPPGAAFRYNGDRFGEITRIIETVSGRRLAEIMVEEILRPLGLRDTAPNVHDRGSFAATGLDRTMFEANMARGYVHVGKKVEPTDYPTYFGAAAGLIGSVRDMARFSIAVDQGRFLQPQTWDSVFSPAMASGRPLPAGLGWFIYDHRGIRMQWAYGWWTGSSSLILRVPARGLTFIVAANSDAMSSKYRLGGDANVLRSDVARLFIESFVTGKEPMPPGTQAATTGALTDALRAHVKSDRFEIVTSVRGLPLGVRDEMQRLFGSATLDIADLRAAFRGAGAAGDPELPTRRLAAAGCSVEYCLVYYERAGSPRTWHVALFRWTPDATRFEWGGSAPGGLATLDAVRKAILSGAIKGPAKVW
jgi:CubicO group peptidase (beta-lactamase class C family)